MPTIPWPHQHCPTDTSWSIWRGFLQKSFTTLLPYTRSNKHWRLSVPLGDWVTKTPYTYRDYYSSPSNGQLYALSDGNFSIYEKVATMITLYEPTGASQSTLPDD
eukprot:10404854-Ditylum_brightwellii.AAC.1